MTNDHAGKSAPWRQDVRGCLAERIGSGGLTAGELAGELDRLVAVLDDLRSAYDRGDMALLRLPDERADIEAARNALDALSEDARTIVFFGTGGSSLGGQTLAQFAGWNIPGLAMAGQSGRPRTRFYDNLDADTLARAIARLDPASTRFIAISKSGNTPETLAQTITAIEALRAAGLGDRIGDHFLGLTEPHVPGRANGLRNLLGHFGAPLLDHHTGIGGRFSVFTNVGLLAAMARGFDPFRLRAGARDVVCTLREADNPGDCPPAVGAAVSIGLARNHGISNSVLMPYGDRFARFTHWYAQLWAESLGKSGKGMTPVGAIGPLDQHSQLQLFMDGPRDHMLTFLRVAPGEDGTGLDGDLATLAGIEYLAGRRVADLVAAQARAVPEALMEAGRPVRTFDAERLDEETIGGLLMHFMIETILAAALLEVDPFDQPAVERGKQLARLRLEEGGG